MGADNWTTCHICNKKLIDKYDKNLEKVKATYGKVTAEEYEKNIQLAKLAPSTIEHTLREDYEIGIEDGVLYISYNGTCSRCKFSFDYKKEVSTTEQ